ncbi:MAG: thiolase domain-containing protein [Chloroflexi bacterium]|nr:thiolase domain-containing protein [Chloroflexota bacterium]
MRDVAIIGLGQTPVAEHWDSSLRDLATQALREALTDADISDLSSVDAMYVGNAYGAPITSQSQLGALLADLGGLRGIEAYTVEAAEASGAAALRTGYLAVASGAVETAIVLGIEKATDRVGADHLRARGVSLDADYEAIHGATLPALAGLLMRRYMHEYGIELSAFENFSANAHLNGSTNANAMFRNKLKPGAFAKAPSVAAPVSLFDGAPDADGAAAVILTSADRAGDLVPQPIHIAASAVATDALALHDRADLLTLMAAQRAAQKAYAAAGIGPDDLDLFELHDAFTVISALTLEATGFAARGEGWKLAQESLIGREGSIPLSTFGGLKSRGNPIGATGIYQAVEATLQLRGAAGANQVADARIAMIQNLGGLGSTAITHILRA